MGPPSQRRKLRSPVWEFFTPVVIGESARCKFCNALVKTSRGSTSGLARHLEIHHDGYGGNLNNLRRELKRGAVGSFQCTKRNVVPLDGTGPMPQRMLVSPMWEFFDPVVFKKTAKCKICNVVIKTSYGSTSGLSSHLKTKHGTNMANLTELRRVLSMKEQGIDVDLGSGTGPSAVVPLDGTGPMPQRKLVSPMWEFFDPVVFRKTAKCKICNVIIKTSYGSTSGLSSHLHTKHRTNIANLAELRRVLSLKVQGIDVDAGSGAGPSGVVPLDSSGPQPIRQLISPMWDFFVPVVYKKNAKCKICGTVISTTGGSTTGLARHMRSMHIGNYRTLKRKTFLEKKYQTVNPNTIIKTEPVDAAQSDSDKEGMESDGNSNDDDDQDWEDTKDKKRSVKKFEEDNLTSQHGGNLKTSRKEMWLKRQDQRQGTEKVTDKFKETDSEEEVQKVDTVDSQRDSEDELEDDGAIEKWAECEQMSVEECEVQSDPLLDKKDEDVADPISQHPVGDSNHQKIRRRLRSSVWKFFVPGPTRKSAKCNICGITVKTTKSSTSGLASHLKVKHSRNAKFLKRKGWQRNVKAENRHLFWHNSENKRTDLTDSHADEVLVDNDQADEVSEDEGCEDGPLKIQDGPRSKLKFTVSVSARGVGEQPKDNTCFACHAKFSGESVPQFSKKEYRFLFMEMLEIPIRKSVSYLEQLEETETWIVLCKSCQCLVKESISTREKITCFQLQLEKLQGQFLKKLKANLGKGPVKYSEAQRKIADDIKKHVQSKEYSVLDSTVDFVGSEQPFNPTMESDVYLSESDQDEASRSQVLYCGLCDDDKIYESKALLSAHTKDVHSPFARCILSSRSSSPPSSSTKQAPLEVETEDDNDDDDNQDGSISRAGEPMTWITTPVPCASYQYRYECPNCPEVKDNTLTQYALHLTLHQRRPYKCVVCSELHPEDKDLREAHWKDNHSNITSPPDSDKFVQIKFCPGQIWKCQSCLNGFFSVEDRDEHERKCPPPTTLKWAESKPQTCKICDTRFRNFAEWRLHRALCHSEEDSMSCYYCDKSFCEKTVEGLDARNDLKMVDHLQKEHGTMKLLSECEPCGLLFEPGLGKTEHMAERHGIPANKVYPCGLCDVSYSTTWTLRRHMSTSHFQRSLLFCDMCGAKFFQPASLLNHNFASHGIVPDGKEVLTCPEEGCNFKTILKGKFNVHISQVHEALRSRLFICKHCGKAFKNRTYLRQHEDLHSNSETKPFQCELCGSSFAVKNYLTVHKKLQHEGKKTKNNRKRISEKQGGESDPAISETTSTGTNMTNYMPSISTCDIVQPEETL